MRIPSGGTVVIPVEPLLTAVPGEEVAQLLLEYPLYKQIKCPEKMAWWSFIGSLRLYNGVADHYCAGCARASTFKFHPSSSAQAIGAAMQTWLNRKFGLREEETNGFLRSGQFELTAVCSRNSAHRPIAHFDLQVTGSPGKEAAASFQKFGQLPSFASATMDRLQGYSGLLTAERLMDLRSAHIVASHSYFVGAFAYLRRVFEYLIDTARDERKSREPSFDVAPFDNFTMEDKIRALQGYLPERLVENAVLYKVLSEGIHGLSEEQCALLFPKVASGTSLILERALESKRKAAAEDEYLKAINAAHSANDQNKP